jgi:hypothetical protein
LIGVRPAVRNELFTDLYPRLKKAGEGKTMFQTVTRIIKWASIPVLLIAAILSPLAGRYELAASVLICMGATVVVQRTIRLKQYAWAAEFAMVVVVFSPVLLATKVFVLMGLASIAACVTILTAFRRQPLPLD